MHDLALAADFGATILVTVHLDHVVPEGLEPIDIVLVIGTEPQKTLSRFARAIRQDIAFPQGLDDQSNRVIAWLADGEPFAMQPQPCRAERIRQQRKYAEGDLRWRRLLPRSRQQTQSQGAESRGVLPDRGRHRRADVAVPSARASLPRWIRDVIKDPVLARRNRAHRAARGSFSPANPRSPAERDRHARHVARLSVSPSDGTVSVVTGA
jgi:hypothetical protein